jgi:hypothetical protein
MVYINTNFIFDIGILILKELVPTSDHKKATTPIKTCGKFRVPQSFFVRLSENHNII